MLGPDQNEGCQAPCSRDHAPLLGHGTTFARYMISHCVGRGGMGAVYEARHAVLNKRVALKTLHGAPAEDEALRARFLREAELAARVRHPHVVDIYDAGVEDGVPFLAMELLEGEDLAQRLAREGRLLAREAVDIVIPMIAGLSELHRVGIAHRDVKPENIFLAYDTHGNIVVKLIDFGISKDFDADASERASQVEEVPSERRHRRSFEGTPHYMAPELMRGEGGLDARTDQYALGVVLYQCLSGVLPYQGASLLDLAYCVCSGEYAGLDTLRSDLAPELLAVVARAMSCAIEDRYPSMEALGRALLPFASPELCALHELTLSRGLCASLPPARSSAPPAPVAPVSGVSALSLAQATTLSALLDPPAPVRRLDRPLVARCVIGAAMIGALLAGLCTLKAAGAPSREVEPALSASALVGPVPAASVRLSF